MKRVICALVLLAGCASTGSLNSASKPPPTVASHDAAGNRLESLIANGAQSCSADAGWCVSDDGKIKGPDHVERVAVTNLRDGEEQHAWPFVIRVSGANNTALVGLTYMRSEGYSGGGASETWLTLYQVSLANDHATPLMSVMLNGSADIRACFGEEDTRNRRDACADQYDFTGALNLVVENTDHWPRLRYMSEAWTYPGHVSREQDSTTKAPLKASDLIWVRDETCSYQRTFARTGDRYTPDAPTPECTDYRTQ